VHSTKAYAASTGASSGYDMSATTEPTAVETAAAKVPATNTSASSSTATAVASCQDRTRCSKQNEANQTKDCFCFHAPSYSWRRKLCHCACGGFIADPSGQIAIASFGRVKPSSQFTNASRHRMRPAVAAFAYGLLRRLPMERHCAQKAVLGAQFLDRHLAFALDRGRENAEH
jgi:hypothetical protein